MEFRIADTFLDSLARLSGEEQKAVKTTAFELQVDASRPGLQFHKLERAKDARFWSVRASSNLRLIVHRSGESLLLCFAGHHDAAYQWAERRRLEIHPKTGAAQLVELREMVVEIPTYVNVAQPRRLETASGADIKWSRDGAVLGKLSEAQLLSLGVPDSWVESVQLATEDELCKIVEHLPTEAAEAVLELATGGTPPAWVWAEKAAEQAAVQEAEAKDEEPLPATTNVAMGFAHPDAMRRFRVIENAEELAQALDAAWEKWSIFLHPAQRRLADKDFSGPARVAGSAGTGKTVVALHRAVQLARRDPEARVLLATFSDALARSLHDKLKILVQREPRLGERVDVYSLDSLAKRLYELRWGALKLAAPKRVREILQEAAREAQTEQGGKGYLTPGFLRAEWEQVADAWQLGTWEEYRKVPRLGRKTRLTEGQREILWGIFEKTRAALRAEGTLTHAEVYARLAAHYQEGAQRRFAHAVVDECQDIRISQLRFLAAMVGSGKNGLFFAGDLGQRIFQQPFSWKSAGVDLRGRAATLRVNYRTSHQIRRQADGLLGKEVKDVDGNVESRQGTVSVFNGPEPEVRLFGDEGEELSAVAAWLRDRKRDGLRGEEMAIVVRSEEQVERAKNAVAQAGMAASVLDERLAGKPGEVRISTMHLAKGLEYRAVAVMACDDEVVPLAARLEAVGEETDLEDVYETERQLLYVACTRARDWLLVTGVKPGSEFLGDLGGR